ncbi:hypothetical protein EP073_03085 [Geovibrio thiophilus]|uniref:Uncharacterized protein n=1 Tax=Geovibrio thiophilus TaxID=139438 RepID=A0A410JWI8_9BACT|nr:hypothetical protein [Geovibrio thiophilus]QAR32418.1 hypothetical protein EP073_03085 [Geovibrio thiophilus]
MRGKFFAIFIFFIMMMPVLITGCGSGPGSSDGGESVYSMLPEPETGNTASLSSSGLFNITQTSLLSGQIGGSPLSDYASYAARDNMAGWAFGLDRDALEATLGESVASGYENSIAEFIDEIFTHPSVTAKLHAAVENFPLFSGVNDIASLSTLHSVRLKSVSVADGVYTESGAQKSVITLNFILPFELTSQNPDLSACSDAITEIETNDNLSEFISPVNTEWSYEISASLVFFADDLSGQHDEALLTKNSDILGEEEEAAAARNFGQIIWFLENLNSHQIPSYDAMFVFSASNSLISSTLGKIHGTAKGNEDVGCLMAVDALMPEAALIIPNITDESYLDTDYEYYTHTYNDDLDGVTDGDEHGAACLHDKDGKIVIIDGESSCATATGTYDLSDNLSAAGSSVLSGMTAERSVRTPYQKIVQGAEHSHDDVSVRSTSGICNKSPWSHLRTPRFGRGIRLAVSEWAVHGQVADHWNIHWYQRPGSALAQSAISDAAYLIKLIAQDTLVGGSWWGFAFASAGQAYKYASKFNISVAGHKMGGDTNSRIGDLIVALIRYGTMASSVKQYLTSIGISETVDGIAQMIQTQATGWQDYYSGSHKVCGYQFN